jgi:hypothetical protein
MMIKVSVSICTLSLKGRQFSLKIFVYDFVIFNTLVGKNDLFEFFVLLNSFFEKLKGMGSFH